MPAVTVRDLPPEVRNELAARAARAGQSLQEYLWALLVTVAQRPDPADVLRRVRARLAAEERPVEVAEIVDVVRQGRGRRV